MTGELADFAVKLDFGIAGLQVGFTALSYKAGSDGKTDFDVKIGGVQLLGALAFLQKLSEQMKLLGDKRASISISNRPAWWLSSHRSRFP